MAGCFFQARSTRRARNLEVSENMDASPRKRSTDTGRALVSECVSLLNCATGDSLGGVASNYWRKRLPKAESLVGVICPSRAVKGELRHASPLYSVRYIRCQFLWIAVDCTLGRRACLSRESHAGRSELSMAGSVCEVGEREGDQHNRRSLFLGFEFALRVLLASPVAS